MILTRFWTIDLILGFAGLVVLAYLYMTRKFKFWKNLGVVAPTPTPFIGNFGDCMMMKKSAGEWLQDLYNYGAGQPFMGFFVFDRPFFMARDPEIIKSILVKDFSYFQDRFATSSPEDRLGDANLFLIKNPAWKYLRSKITPIYTSGRVKRMFELMTEVGEDLNVHMKNLPWNGEILELSQPQKLGNISFYRFIADNLVITTLFIDIFIIKLLKTFDCKFPVRKLGNFYKSHCH